MKKIINLENSIYLAVFLIPLYLIKIKIFGLPMNLWEIFFGVIFIAWIVKRWREIKIKEFYYDYKKYIFCAGLILVGLLISFFYNYVMYYVIDYLHSLGIIISWFLIPLIFMLMAADVVPREKRTNIFKAYYLSAFSAAVIALVYLILGQVTFDGRLQAIFNSPNYLAMYLAPALITVLAQFQISNFKFQINVKCQNFKLKNIFFAISFLIILVVFYKTYSYAAWISAIISLIIIFFIQKKVSLRKILIIAAIFILLIFSQIKNNKFDNLINFNERSSLASRAMIWKSAGKIIADNKIFGIGAGNFQNKYLEYQKYYPPYLEWAVPHPHNLYLAFWLYGGVVGLFGFLALIFFYLRDILKKIKVETPRRGVSTEDHTEILYISLGIMLYILIHGLVDTTYFKNDLAIVFWLCFLALKKKEL